MKLPILNSSVIVVDTSFLKRVIKDNHDFYSDLYPGREFKDISLIDMIRSIAMTSGAINKNEPVSVIFYFKLDNSILPFTSDPKDVFIFNDFVNRPINLKFDDCVFSFASLFADPESDDNHRYLEEFSQLLTSIASNSNTSNISIIVDDIYFEDTFLMFNELFNKKFVIYRSTETEMYLPEPPKFWNVNLDYIIADTMGVDENEI